MHKLFRHITSCSLPKFGILKFGIFGVSILGVLLTLGGCSSGVFEECPDAQGEGGWFSLTVNAMSSSGGQSTRAEIYEELGGTFAENYIDLAGGDYRIYLVDNSNNLVCELRPEETLDEDFNFYLAEYASSSLTFKLDQKQLNKITDNTDNLSFHILMLANFGANGASYPTINEGTAYALSDLKSYEGRSFTATLDANDQWIPNPKNENKRLIPFCGQQIFSYPRELMRYTSFDNPARLDNVLYLMRSMAKIEIADCIDHENFSISYEGDSKVYPYVTDVRLVDWQPRGYGVSPDLIDGQRYLDASHPWAWNAGKSDIPMMGQSITPEASDVTLPGEWTGLGAPKITSGDVFRFYVPEMAIGNATGSNPAKISVTLATHKDASGNVMTETFVVDLSSQAFVAEKWNNKIVRNYIYRVELYHTTSNLELEAKVLPWVIRKNNIEF